MKRYQTQAIVCAIISAGYVASDQFSVMILGMIMGILALILTLAGDE